MLNIGSDDQFDPLWYMQTYKWMYDLLTLLLLVKCIYHILSYLWSNTFSYATQQYSGRHGKKKRSVKNHTMYNALKYSGVSQLVSRKPLFKPCFLKSIKPITHVTHTSDGTSVFTVCYSVSDSSDRVWGCPVTVSHHQRGGIHDTVWLIRETEEWMFLLWHINNTVRVSKTEGGLESCLHSQLC